MTPKAKSKHEEALQFLDDLDNISRPSDNTIATVAPAVAEGEEDVLAFIDEITQKTTEPIRLHFDRPTSRAGTPTLRKSTERVKLSGAPILGQSLSASSSTSSLTKISDKSKSEPAPAGMSWGLGSVWNTASAAIQQARTVVDEQVKALPKSEQARKWGEGVIEYAKAVHLDKIGQDFKRVGLSTLTDILNVVAPPISEHEVIQVWLSHEIEGNTGVESLVYHAFSKVMEQVEGGDLVVNQGHESQPKRVKERNFNAIEGFDAAIRLAQAEINAVIKGCETLITSHNRQSQTTYSNIYLRIQPFREHHAVPVDSEQLTSRDDVRFLLCLSDPTYKLLHVTTSQAVPEKWLIHWDHYDWVDGVIAEILRVAVEVIGQEYLVSRMGWSGNSFVGSSQRAQNEELTSDIKRSITLNQY